MSPDDAVCEQLEIGGRRLQWQRTGDHLTFPSQGDLVFAPDFYTFEGSVTFEDGRTEVWRGTRCRFHGKMQQFGQYS